MTVKLLLFGLFATVASGQVPVHPVCTPERPCTQRVRLAEWFSYSLADRKVLPDISDLKGRSLNTEVLLNIAISKTGEVIHAHAVAGNPVVFKRSEDAALKWHYKPYVLSGSPIEVDSELRFRFEKNKVQVVVPPRKDKGL
jgi:hypothetical protein